MNAPQRLKQQLSEAMRAGVKLAREAGLAQRFPLAARVTRALVNEARLEPLRMRMRLAKATNKRVAIFSCAQPSHFQNVSQLPHLLSRSEWAVFVLCAFDEATYRVDVPEHVHVEYGPVFSLKRELHADVFVSPEVTGKPEVPRGARSVHFLVSLAGLEGVYDESHFDGWDYIVCAGAYQIDDFRRLAARRALSGKVLIPGGYPKLDRELARLQTRAQPQNPPVIVYAPTHVYGVNKDLASLQVAGFAIVDALVGAGYHVLLRPHPVSLKDASDRAVVDRIDAAFKHHARYELDQSRDYAKTYDRADLMVTDLSGTGFTFAFSRSRPAIFFAHNEAGERGMQGFHFSHRATVGGVVRDTGQLLARIPELLQHFAEARRTIEQLRTDSIFNLGHSEAYVADHLLRIARGERAADWVTLS